MAMSLGSQYPTRSVSFGDRLQRLYNTVEEVFASLVNNYTVLAFEQLPVLNWITNRTYPGFEGGGFSGINEIIYQKLPNGEFREVCYRLFRKRRFHEGPINNIDEIVFDERTRDIRGYRSGVFVPLGNLEPDLAFERSGAGDAILSGDFKRTTEKNLLLRAFVEDSLRYIREHKSKREIAGSNGQLFSVTLKNSEGIGNYGAVKYLDPAGYDLGLIGHYMGQTILYGLLNILPFGPIKRALKSLGVNTDTTIREQYRLVAGAEQVFA